MVTNIGPGNYTLTSLAIGSDSKILAAGYGGIVNTFDIALVRYNPDGSLDTGFSGDGKLTTDFGSSNDAARSLVIQTDGKIVVAGHSNVTGSYDFALVRYNPNGSFDSSFDGDGKLTTAIGTSEDELSSMGIQSDGKIVVAGSAYRAGINGFALVRYNTDGSLDTGFDAMGS